MDLFTNWWTDFKNLVIRKIKPRPVKMIKIDLVPRLDMLEGRKSLIVFGRDEPSKGSIILP